MRTVGYIPGKKAKKQASKAKDKDKPLTKAEVIEKLTAAGIEFDENAKLEELLGLLPTE